MVSTLSPKEKEKQCDMLYVIFKILCRLRVIPKDMISTECGYVENLNFNQLTI
jgi:hypothetical protein